MSAATRSRLEAPALTTGRCVLNHARAVAFRDAKASTPPTCFPLSFETIARAVRASWIAASIASEAVGICVHSVQRPGASRYPPGFLVFVVRDFFLVSFFVL